MKYLFAGGSIEIPDTWLDRSVHTFIEDGSDGTPKSSLVIHEAPTEVALDDFVDQQLIQAAQKLNSYRLHRRRQAHKGFEVSYEWRPSHEVIVQQRQLFTARSRHVVMVVTLTTMTSEAIRMEGLWAALLTSLCVVTEANNV